MDSELDFLAAIALLNIIGVVAAALTALSLLPGVIDTYRTKKSSGISWGYHWFLLAGLLAWSLYGLLFGHLLVASASAIALLEIAILMFWKSKYG